MIERVLIVGLGLMGGSLGMALRRLSRRVEVGGCDLDPSVGERALQRGAIDRLEHPDRDDVERYQAVFVATPVRSISPLLIEVGARVAPGTILTDLGSTKSHIQRELQGRLSPAVEYVGGHPMTGSEVQGLDGADPHLYENAVWILTRPGAADAPGARSAPGPLDALRALLEELGALVIVMDPEDHDRTVAMTSHVPYLAAVALVNALARRFASPREALALAAGGFLDTTRVAAGPAPVYRDIVMTNAGNIAEGLGLLIEELAAIRDAVRRCDPDALVGRLERARCLRATLPRFGRGTPLPLFELVVKAQDRPGFLGEIATVLGQRRINIKDFVLMHVREGEPGTILLAFRTEEDLSGALATLSEAGFAAQRR
jgi:prephenate dehydrogenase